MFFFVRAIKKCQKHTEFESTENLSSRSCGNASQANFTHFTTVFFVCAVEIAFVENMQNLIPLKIHTIHTRPSLL